ncbi:MAG: hypothetical protein R3346_03165 [Candidatus Spechtbacterales bacterium]|nr:hypothetical protein [Candidatus Spechtbacterales bacterium]
MNNFFEGKPQKEEDIDKEDEILDLVHSRLDFDRLRVELGSVFGDVLEEDPEILEREITGRYRAESQNFLKKESEKKSKQNKRDNENRIKSIDKAIEGLGKIVIELKEKINDYDAIVSDDASGRLISLILREVFKNEKGEGLPMHFVLGGRYLSYEGREEKMKEYLKERVGGVKKVLLVTEYIRSGKSLSRIVEALEEMGIDFDIVTLSTNRIVSDINYPEFYDKIIVGKEQSDSGLDFYAKSRYSGVYKQLQGAYNPDEMPEISELPSYPAKVRDFNSDTVNEARRDVKMIAEELSKLLED